MNKLDGKVILAKLDAHILHIALRALVICEDRPENKASLVALAEIVEQALAQDLTGWAAVRVEMTEATAEAFFHARDVEFTRQATEAQKAGKGWYSMPAVVWSAMLNASPPLAGDGE
jgi:hypothetical protein